MKISLQSSCALLVVLFAVIAEAIPPAITDTKVIPSTIPNLANKTNATQDESKSAFVPPLIFPSDPGAYKILSLDDASPNNETAIKILLTKARQESEGNTKDNGAYEQVSKNIITKVDSSTTSKPIPIEPIKAASDDDVDEDLKNEVEEIQKPEESEEQVGLEELYHKQPNANLQVNQVFAEDIETNSGDLHGGHITAIVGGILAFVCIAIYVGLISWRSYLEKRYGMREQLVTEDDYYNNNDIRHFAL